MTNTTAWLFVTLMTLCMASCAAAQDDAPTDTDMTAAVAADLSDAQAQARQEFRAQTRAALAHHKAQP